MQARRQALERTVKELSVSEFSFRYIRGALDMLLGK